MMQEPALQVRDLSVEIRLHAGSVAVLHEIDLTVSPGTIMGLIGESGSGKTTLANAILGILPAGFVVLSGEVRLHGQALEGAAQPRRNARIAYVPQDPSSALDPLFTVGAQIDDLLRARRPDLRGNAARRDCAIEHLVTARLTEPVGLLRRRPHEVSGGQRQRLMIAMALMTQPTLIVADEPTTALDLTTQAQILSLIRRLTDTHGVTVLLTTHDPGVAHEVCDMISVMQRGRIVEAASTAQVLRQPCHPYTRRLLAARRRGAATAPSPDSPLAACRHETVR
jgi:peptide/nickel transport system ATP-binding protein